MKSRAGSCIPAICALEASGWRCHAEMQHAVCGTVVERYSLYSVSVDHAIHLYSVPVLSVIVEDRWPEDA